MPDLQRQTTICAYCYNWSQRQLCLGHIKYYIMTQALKKWILGISHAALTDTLRYFIPNFSLLQFPICKISCDTDVVEGNFCCRPTQQWWAQWDAHGGIWDWFCRCCDRTWIALNNLGITGPHTEQWRKKILNSTEFNTIQYWIVLNEARVGRGEKTLFLIM